MNTKKVYIAGHNGMVGSAILDELRQRSYEQLVLAPMDQLDLRDQAATRAFLKRERPDAVIIAAAVVGGILANSQYPWQFLYDNLLIEANLIGASHEEDIPRLIFLGSSCIYPKMAPQPLKEEYLLEGPLEPTNEWYAIAKIAGIKLCQALNRQYGRNYVSLMPTNLYGPRDNFDLQTSHVLPAMIRKFHEAKEGGHLPVELWGSGSPHREFLHVQDLARAVRFILERSEPLPYDLINVGTGTDLPIRDLAAMVQRVVGHEGPIQWDTQKPDGTPRKLMDTHRINALGWQAQWSLEEGIANTYRWYLEQTKT